jgi:hypothetical protein
MKIVLALLLVFLVSSQAASLVEIEQLIEGMMVGAFGEEGKAAQECIEDGEKIFVDIEAAIQDFEKGGAVNIAKGLFHIGIALEGLPDSLADCKGAQPILDDIKKIAARFKDTSSLVVHIGQEIIFHGFSIFHDITDCVSNFKKGDYEGAGEEIGDIIQFLLLVDAKKLTGRQESTEFVEGFFKGSLRDDSADVIDCIDDANDIIDELEKIISDIKAGLLDNFEELFLDFIDLLAEIPRSVVQCEAVPADIVKYESWILDLKDSKIMEKRLFNAFLYYGADIKTDSKGLIDDYERGMYTSSGYYLGDILYILFDEVHPISIVEGLLKE